MELGVSTKKLGDGTSRLERPGVASANGHYVVFHPRSSFLGLCTPPNSRQHAAVRLSAKTRMWAHVTKITARCALISAQ